ncbi:MAG TPA: hypothetical protein VFS21_02615 [Roseiflexaceae bacterium]|nr:hypothetical protein [Roseiflexaceae bacterium]
MPEDVRAFLTSYGVGAVSPLGERAAQMLSILFYGMHNAWRKIGAVDWSNPTWIEIAIDGDWSTYDNTSLTRLVLTAHDLALRCNLSPRSYRRMTLMIHPRERDGQHHQRHPTIEQALEEWRRYHPIEATYGYQPGSEAPATTQLHHEVSNAP